PPPRPPTSAKVRGPAAGGPAPAGTAAPGRRRSAAAPAASDLPLLRYAEDAVESKKVAAGSERDRYEIDIHQFRFETGISDRVGFNMDITHEAMSGATPWYVTPGPDGTPVQVMTQATIEEARTDALLAGDYY